MSSMREVRIPICLTAKQSDVLPKYRGVIAVHKRMVELQMNINGEWKTVFRISRGSNFYVMSDGINVRVFNPGKWTAYVFFGPEI